MLAQIRAALVALVVLTLLTGVAYPLAVTGIAKLAFQDQAEGSLIVDSTGKVVGSRLIGQSFSEAKYFWGRLSATTVDLGVVGREGATAPRTVTGEALTVKDAEAPAPSLPYNGGSSVGSNYGPTSPDLTKAAADRIQALREADPDNHDPVPVDLVTASGSGLDPDISPAAARFQVHRVAGARGRSDDEVKALVLQHTKAADLGVLGEARVNVLALNMALDGLR
jgi:K+-transporting ATPase ATPase C chain